MTQKFTIAGVGEAILSIDAERTTIVGTAVEAALMAIQHGHRGVVVSRVGQDEAGADVMQRCLRAGLEVGHLQTDPDLATGRRVTRRMGAQVRHSTDEWAAYDNLQWDFDLEDLSQRIDAVVCGGLALRGTQTRSTVERMLASCSAGARFLVVSEADDPTPHRVDLAHVLGFMDGICLDRETLGVIWPSFQRDSALSDVLPAFARSFNLDYVLLQDAQTLSVCADGQLLTASRADADSSAVSMTAMFAISLLGGATIEDSANVGARARLQEPSDSNDAAPDASAS